MTFIQQKLCLSHTQQQKIPEIIIYSIRTIFKNHARKIDHQINKILKSIFSLYFFFKIRYFEPLTYLK